MTVCLIAPNGRTHYVFVNGAASESRAIAAAKRTVGAAGTVAAWVLPGDAR